MFDPKTVSEMLQVPASTLRRYAKDWGEFLSDSARIKGKKRRYTPEDITTLRRIRVLLGQHKNREEIAAALDVSLKIVDETPPETTALAFMPELIEELEGFRSRFAQLEGELESERLDNRELQERVNRLEEWLLLPWWRRFGRKPPD